MGRPRITVWNEYLHELENPVVRAIYPDGIHAEVASAVAEHLDAEIRTATLRQPQHGLSQDVLDATDVLFWWGHRAHAEVADEVVERVHQAVLEGMGLVVLHSGHVSKVFQRVLGTSGWLRWREADEKERLWNLEPSHPLLQGIPEQFELAQEEMYGERFDVPTPDELLMISWFQGGEVFRSLCTWRRGHGRVVYFRPGHEAYPTYRHPHVRRILANAAGYAAGSVRIERTRPIQVEAFEPVPNPTKDHIG